MKDGRHDWLLETLEDIRQYMVDYEMDALAVELDGLVTVLENHIGRNVYSVRRAGERRYNRNH